VYTIQWSPIHSNILILYSGHTNLHLILEYHDDIHVYTTYLFVHDYNYNFAHKYLPQKQPQLSCNLYILAIFLYLIP